MVKKQLLKMAIVLVLFNISIFSAVQAGGNGTSNSEFLRIGAGAKPAAMGGAYTAIANDVNATFWNPAGLAQVQGREFSFMHLSWFDSLNYEYLAYAERLTSREGIGAHLIYFWVPDFNSTIDETGTAHDTIEGKMSDIAVAFSYGNDLGYLKFLQGETSVGITVKALSKTLMDQNVMSYALDAGLMIKSDRGLVLAFTINNLGTVIDQDRSPLTFKMGIGYPAKFLQSIDQLRVACDLIKPIDLANLQDSRFEVAGGLEYTVLNAVALRVGYLNGQSLSGFTAGLGGRYEFLQLDYAFAPYGELGYTHRFSISFDFPSADALRQLEDRQVEEWELEKEYAPMLFKMNY